MKELKVAIKAAKESGKILTAYLKKNIKVDKKSDMSPVTIADRESEKMIVSIIKKYFSQHNILGEEYKYKQTNSEYKWIIDPLDGTKNFIRRMPFFGNCIALEKNNVIVVGAINIPTLNLLAYASFGKGAFVNEKRIKTSNTTNIKKSFLCFGDINKFHELGYGDQFLELVNLCDGHRGYGDTLAYLLLAQGFIDIVLDFGKLWDIAAAKIIIEEAGGKMTDFKGNATIYSGNSIATNCRLHDKVIKILNKK